MSLNDTYTSTGHKFFAHQEAMAKLRNGKGQPIVSHVMLTDICNHSCAFCSVQARAGDSLAFNDVMDYLTILISHGLKAVILSGGGNPILYKCKKTGKSFNDVVSAIYGSGLEIGLITNGAPLYNYAQGKYGRSRQSWKGVKPETLDKLTWIRISMSGLDHPENEVYVPDIDPDRTTLGFSYVGHDIYEEPKDPYHGKVSRPLDLISGDKCRAPELSFEDRVNELTQKITWLTRNHSPLYVRLLPNCLEPEKIPARCVMMQEMAEEINSLVGAEVVFVQQKPPQAPKACLLGVIHPVLNCDGYCYPCDSCILNEEAGHKFSNPWRMCHWSDIGKLYEGKLPHSLIDDPSKRCPGCVFTHSCNILADVRDGVIKPTPPLIQLEHVNFV